MAHHSGTVHHYTLGDWQCGGTARVSDPSHGRDAVNYAGELTAVKGPWGSHIVRDIESGLVAALVTWARGSPTPSDGDAWTYPGFAAGTDSGQCGVFDGGQYRGGEKDFYEAACAATSGELSFGLACLKGAILGVVSASGGGDDLYAVEVRAAGGPLARGPVDAIRITYFDPEDDPDLPSDGL